MKRTSLRRGRPLRRTRLRRKLSRRRERIGRPPRQIALGPGWATLAKQILARDQARCRFCGFESDRPIQVDHLIPRRLLASKAEASEENNLAALCDEHHAVKSHAIEPALYRGDVQRFERFLAVVAETGPIPDADWRATAYARAAEHLRSCAG